MTVVTPAATSAAPILFRQSAYIGGEWIDTVATIPVHNPAPAGCREPCRTWASAKP